MPGNNKKMVLCINGEKYEVGKDISLDEILNSFDYAILANGKSISRKSNIEGSENVLSAIDFLKLSHNTEFINTLPNDFVLYGLGNVSIDIAIFLKSLNKNVEIYYHKPRELSRLSHHDIKKIDEYNLNVIFDTRIVKVENDTLCFENKGEIYKKNNVYPIFAIGQLIDYSFLDGSSVNSDFTDFKSIYTKIDNLYIAGDLCSSRADISTGIKTAFDITNDILSKN